MMKRSVAHIGIAVRDLKVSIPLFSKLLGKSPDYIESVEDQKVKTALFTLTNSAVELLEPASADSPVGKFLEKRGEGIHHLSIDVEDISRELARLKREGFELIDEKPRSGANQCLVAFVHPKSTNGVLIELSQKVR